MTLFRTLTRSAAGIAAAVALAATPAHAYKVSDTFEVNGKLFADWTVSAEDDKNAGFHSTRNYFEVKAKVWEDDSVRITLDTKALESATGLKYAYWEHKINGSTKTRAGLHHTPLVDYDQEKVWGHRYVEKAFTDHVGAQTSSDSGVSLMGNALDKHVDYHLSIQNGEGYGHAADGNGYAYSGRVEYTTAGIHVGAFGYVETEHLKTAASGPTPAVFTPNRERYLGYAYYQADAFEVGGQYLTANDSDATKFNDGTGYSVQANVNLPVGNKAVGFVRYDSMEYKDTDLDPTTLTVAGVEFAAAPGITLAPTYKNKDTGTATETTVAVYGQFKF
ncbi:MAG: hypothetical protein HZA24_00245 [Nitrospirae bacterium]|nr:hypothetical protein [Nitrospirota bacterium]